MATTAVVAGTAGAVSHRQQQRWQNKAMEQQQVAMQQQQQTAESQQLAEMQAQMQAMQAQQATAAAGGADVMAQLQQLAQMKEQGLLTDEQFEAAKAKLLGV
jgi:hypothetical protein